MMIIPNIINSIEFESVKFKNFLCFGSKWQDIPLLSGLNIITGEDVDTGKKNGCGKSSFMELIPFALFGKIHKDIKKEQIVNWKNRKSCEVHLKFSKKNDKYKIIRGIKPNIFEIYKNDILLDKPAHVKDYQKILNDNLGLNYTTFMSLVHSNINSSVKILSMKKPDKRKFLEKMFGLDIYNKLNDNSNLKIKNINEKIREIDFSIKYNEQSLKDLEKRINDLKQKIGKIKPSNKILKILKDKLLLNEEKITKINEKKIKNQLQNKLYLIDKYDGLLLKINKKQTLIKIWIKNVKKDIEKYNENKEKIEKRKKDLKILEKFEIDNGNLETITNKIQDISQLINEHDKSLLNISNKIELNEFNLNKTKKNIEKYNENKEKIEKRKKDLKILEKFEIDNGNLETITNKIQELKLKNINYNNSLLNINKHQNKIKNNISSIKSEIKMKKKDIKLLKEDKCPLCESDLTNGKLLKKKKKDLKLKENVLKKEINKNLILKKEIDKNHNLKKINQNNQDKQEKIKNKLFYLKNNLTEKTNFDFNIKKLELNLKELELNFKNLTNNNKSIKLKKDEKNNQLKELEEKKEKIYKIKNNLKLINIEGLNFNIKELENKNNRFNMTLSNLNKIYKSIKLKKDEKDNQFKELEEKIEKIQKHKNVIIDQQIQIQQIQEKIKNEKEMIENFQSLLEKDELNKSKNKHEIKKSFMQIKKYNEIKDYFKYIKIICKDENIKQYAISSIMPFLNNHTNKYLSKVGYGFYVKLDKWLDVMIKGPGITNATYNSLSGGEGRGIDISVQLSFLDIDRLQANVFFNFLVFDELLDSSIDNVGIKEIFNIIKSKQKEDNSKCFIISHKSKIKDYDEIDNEYHVNKKNGYSTVTIN